eukprot:scaffold22587_cov132-Cylindrotheca_fusiformis.AAC.4
MGLGTEIFAVPSEDRKRTHAREGVLLTTSAVDSPEPEQSTRVDLPPDVRGPCQATEEDELRRLCMRGGAVIFSTDCLASLPLPVS